MHILLTNDDGYDAIGLFTLAKSIYRLGWDAVIVAPKNHMSGSARGRISDIPLSWKKVQSMCGFDTYYVDGSPASCVVFALTSGLFDKFDLCLSGVNAGANLGAGLTISGTFGAALEAISYGVPGIALSRESDTGNVPVEEWDWIPIQDATIRILKCLMEHSSEWRLANINIPNMVESSTPIKFTQISTESYFDDQFNMEFSSIKSRLGFRDEKISSFDDIFVLAKERAIGVSMLQGKLI